MRFIDLSHPMKDGQPSFPGDPVLKVAPHATIEKNRYNVSHLSMGSHQGTHLDALYHFIPQGKPIDQMPLEWFYGPATLLRIPKSRWTASTTPCKASLQAEFRKANCGGSNCQTRRTSVSTIVAAPRP